MLALPVGQVFNQWLTSCSESPTVTYVTEPSDEKQKAFTQMATGSEGEVAFITGVARAQGRAHVKWLAGLGVHVNGVDKRCASAPALGSPTQSGGCSATQSST
jgi:hypothetical protein